MPVRNACNGKVEWNGVEIPDVREWSFDRDQEVKEFSSSSTNCAKKRIEGVEDVSGVVEIYINNDDPFEDILDVGDTGTFNLFEDQTDFWIVPAIIAGFSVNDPIEAGDLVSASIRFNGNGLVTPPAR